MKKVVLISTILAIIAMTTLLITHTLVCGNTADDGAACGTRTTTIIYKNGTKKIIKETGCKV